ncbi:MAG TPA: DJ-1/PfpI family protein [Rhodanobacteraceae bacterium]|jgi:transcriptional regulator GlxA family with amidase domain|nr:DJ-1/PfpI family protein [Rhodanobacteraceae bacterium]
MKRVVLIVCLMLAALARQAAADPVKHLNAPADRAIRVAFVMTEGATMMDFAGPWEVFQDVMMPERGDSMTQQMPFELYTVGISREPVRTSATPAHAGMSIVPDYAFADAPAPDLVVVGAQSGGAAVEDWLRKVHGQGVSVMSVCVGAFILGKAGLLDGKPATTHPAYYKRFAEQNPTVKLARAARYAQADDITYTSGGVSAGIDLALHIVAEYFGAPVAQRTADYMQYQGSGWK